MGAMAAQNQKGEAFLAVPCSAFTPNWRLEHGGQAGGLWLCCVYRTNPPAAVCNGLGGWKGQGGGRLILQGQCLHLFMCDRERWEPGPLISLPSRAVPGGKLPMGEGVGV